MVARLHGVPDVSKQPHGARLVEVAERAPEEREECGTRHLARQLERRADVGDPGQHANIGVPVAKTIGGFLEELLTHIHGHVERQPPGGAHRVENDAGFLGAPRPELDEGSRAKRAHERLHPRVQDLALGAREIVLGEPCDLLEQHGAAVVVEPLWRELLLRARQSGAHFGAHLLQTRVVVGTGQATHRARTGIR